MTTTIEANRWSHENKTTSDTQNEKPEHEYITHPDPNAPRQIDDGFVTNEPNSWSRYRYVFSLISGFFANLQETGQ